MDFDYLQGKIKKSPAFNLIKARKRQENILMQNDIYNFLNQQSLKVVLQNAQQDKQFDQEISKKLDEQPVKIIRSGIMKSNKRCIINYEKKSRQLKHQSLSLKKRYVLETQASMHRASVGTKQMLQQYNKQNPYKLRRSLNFSTSQALGNRPINTQSLTSIPIYSNRKRPKIQIKTLRRTRNSNFSMITLRQINKTQNNNNISKEKEHFQPEHQTQAQHYNSLICKLRKQSKRFQQSLIKSQNKIQALSKINQKIENHFSQLMLQAQDFPDNQYPHQISKSSRYKYDSNNILQNVLSRTDQEVIEWIRNEQNKKLRIRCSKMVQKQHITDQQFKLQRRIKSFAKCYSIMKTNREAKQNSVRQKNEKVIKNKNYRNNQFEKNGKNDQFDKNVKNDQINKNSKNDQVQKNGKNDQINKNSKNDISNLKLKLIANCIVLKQEKGHQTSPLKK